jgi:hypothetical protein
MKVSTVSSIKKELSALPVGEVIEICTKLVKYKKENKELISYLLFDANNEQEFIRGVRMEVDELFSGINHSQLYYAKKSIRKILKITTKYIRYSGIKNTEVELLLFFCTKLKHSGIQLRNSNSLSNLYTNQLRKLNDAINSLHEDLQYDYNKELEALLKGH